MRKNIWRLHHKKHNVQIQDKNERPKLIISVTFAHITYPVYRFNIKWCSDHGENQRHSCSVLSTSASPARVWGRSSRHLDSDETVLGRGTVWETFVQRRHQISQEHKRRKVSNPVPPVIVLRSSIIHVRCSFRKKQCSRSLVCFFAYIFAITLCISRLNAVDSAVYICYEWELPIHITN